MQPSVSFVAREPLPGDIQTQIDLAKNSIALMQGDINRLNEFKGRLQNEVSSLDNLMQEKTTSVQSLEVTLVEKESDLKVLEEKIVSQQASLQELSKLTDIRRSEAESASLALSGLKEEVANATNRLQEITTKSQALEEENNKNAARIQATIQELKKLA